MLIVQDLVKRYKGAIAVDGLSLSIKPGEVLGLVGPNGAGKTTTIKSILGLVKPDRGKIIMDGVELNGRGVRLKRYIGYSPEVPEAPSWSTVCRLLEYLALLDGVERGRVREVVRDALSRLGVDGLCNRRLSMLSKGQKKRVLIAQAILAERRYVLFDEPFTGLDPEWVAEVRRLIVELKERGIGVLVSSHILKELEEVADRVAIISKGRVLFEGTLEELAQHVAKGTTLIVRTSKPAEAARIMEELGVREVEVLSQTVKARVGSEKEAREIVSVLIGRGIDVKGFEARSIDLEEAYLKLIGAERRGV